MRNLLLTLSLIALTGCQSFQEPGLSLKDARLAEGPVIIQRGDHFYLRYRRALEDGRFPLRAVLYVRKTKEAGYYFFSGEISHIEWGNLVERPLAYDDLEDFARRGRIYWLDPDGTKHQIPLRQDAPIGPSGPPISVSIVGTVLKPYTYSLPNGSHLLDAAHAAGGLLHKVQR